ncbi:resistance to glucose repression protein 1 [[Candida] railenensis]|uniref:Resistance to glucose repression protein 1 n=1 Tax=[Candida] railenensis TaxID=45579 RepID=A0A9P0QUX9_9ASCO|nr:resistance to glucose repression protein 1 [[Candida] railenensis]
MSSTSGEVFTGGATTSQHVDAENEDHFENTTFKLKRTRSLGLLDEFIQPTTPADGGDKSEEPQHEELPSSIQAQLLGHGHDESHSYDHAPAAEAADVDFDASKNENEKCVDAIIEAPMHIKSPEMLPHDDTDIKEEPSQHVDYLSHQWDVSDISKSWRYIIQKRRDVADSARLENASWRTWAQRRSNLKTISPEAVNWSKESDVTWLYGPILKDDEHHSHDDDLDSHKRVTTATSAVAGDISLPSSKKRGPKPILKRRTVQDMIISHSNLLKLQLATQRLNQQKEQKRELQRKLLEQQQYEKSHQRKNSDNQAPDFDDYEAISAKLNSQYTNSRNNSSVSLKGLNTSPKKVDSPSTILNSDKIEEVNDNGGSSIHDSTQSTEAIPTTTTTYTDKIDNDNDNDNTKETSSIVEEPQATPMSETSSKENRHIHFSDVVQQCISIEPYSEDEDDDYYEDDSDAYEYDEDAGEDYIYEEGPHQGKRDDDDDDEDDDDDDDDEGGFFLRVPSSASLSAGLPGISMSSGESSGTTENSVGGESTQAASATSLNDNASVSSGDSVRTIHMLPPTTLNHGSSDEESDDDNPYTSSVSHYVNNDSSRGYDYHYDYNTVYTVDPNHAILGTQNQRAPDVVDVPEDIALGSNFDYEQIEHQENSLPIIDPNLINNSNLNRVAGNENPNTLFSTEDDYSGSDSDSDSDDGLSIGTKNSSHSLAQSVFGGGMTNHFNNNATTDNKDNSINATNDNNNTNNTNNNNANFNSNNNENQGINKQPTSSSSLSESFFGGTTGFTKSKGSQSALSDQFFNLSNNHNNNSSNNNYNNYSTTSNYNNVARSSNSPNYSNEQIAPTQRKASPLPPQTTSANAFSGNTTPPQIIPSNNSRNTFLFDSDSDSEDEFIEDVTPQNTNSGAESYAALSHVAGVNGIRSPSPDVGGGATNDQVSHGGKLVGQAKGLANHFLGSWKGNGGSVDEQ